MSVSPVLRRQRREDHCEFEASQWEEVSWRASVTGRQRDPVTTVTYWALREQVGQSHLCTCLHTLATSVYPRCRGRGTKGRKQHSSDPAVWVFPKEPLKMSVQTKKWASIWERCYTQGKKRGCLESSDWSQACDGP